MTTQQDEPEIPDWESEPQKPPRRHKARLKYHQIKCAICNHPHRHAIEEAFLDWARPGDLAGKFKLGHRTVVYRHAHALDLFKKRARSAGFALGLLIEQSSVIKPTGNEIIRAVRAYSCLDQNGKWTDHPRRLIITHLDGKGDELPADKLNADWKLAHHPRPSSEERLAAEESERAKSIATQISQENH